MNATAKNAHVWDREEHDWYVEPNWCVDVFLENEKFTGSIWDPACGMGTIPKACKRAGYENVSGSDIVDRGYGAGGQNFLAYSRKYIQQADNIITNPPYKLAEAFIIHALAFTRRKVAVVVPLKFLASNTRNAMFNDLPLQTVWVLSSRPSMLPGHKVLAGEKAGGGAIDYCWLVFDHFKCGPTELKWLMKPGAKARPYNVKRGRKVSPEASQRRSGGAV